MMPARTRITCLDRTKIIANGEILSLQSNPRFDPETPGRLVALVTRAAQEQCVIREGGEVGYEDYARAITLVVPHLVRDHTVAVMELGEALSSLSDSEIFSAKRGVAGNKVHFALTVKTGELPDEKIILRALASIPSGEFDFDSVSTTWRWKYRGNPTRFLNVPDPE